MPIGTALRNAAECQSGCVVFHDIIQNPEVQGIKKCHDGNSHAPDKGKISARTAELLR